MCAYVINDLSANPDRSEGRGLDNSAQLSARHEVRDVIRHRRSLHNCHLVSDGGGLRALHGPGLQSQEYKPSARMLTCPPITYTDHAEIGGREITQKHSRCR